MTDAEMCHKLAEALRLTQEYVGPDLLPPVPGWSWFDALQDYAAQYDGPEAGTGFRGPVPASHSRENFPPASGTVTPLVASEAENESDQFDGSPS